MTTNKNSLVTINGTSYLIPFILVTSLFFLWGFAHSLLDMLNKHFQEILGITKSRSGFVQAALYGGYAVMAIPAGFIMNRFGYKRGIIFGLRIRVAGNDGSWRSCMSPIYGMDCRYLKYGHWLHCTVGLFCIYIVFRTGEI